MSESKTDPTITYSQFLRLLEQMHTPEMVEAMAAAAGLGMALARFQNALDRLRVNATPNPPDIGRDPREPIS